MTFPLRTTCAIAVFGAFLFSAFNRQPAVNAKDEVVRLINEYRNSGNYNTNIANWSPAN